MPPRSRPAPLSGEWPPYPPPISQLTPSAYPLPTATLVPEAVEAARAAKFEHPLSSALRERRARSASKHTRRVSSQTSVPSAPRMGEQRLPQSADSSEELADEDDGAALESDGEKRRYRMRSEPRQFPVYQSRSYSSMDFRPARPRSPTTLENVHSHGSTTMPATPRRTTPTPSRFVPNGGLHEIATAVNDMKVTIEHLSYSLRDLSSEVMSLRQEVATLRAERREREGWV